MAGKSLVRSLVQRERENSEYFEIIEPHGEMPNSVSCLVDFFELIQIDNLDRDDQPIGAAIAWPQDVSVVRQYNPKSSDQVFEKEVRSNGELLGETQPDRVAANFSCTTVTIRTPFQELDITRTAHSKGVDESTRLTSGQNDWNFVGRINRAWFVDQGRAVAFITNQLEYFVVVDDELISFGAVMELSSNFYNSKPCFISESRQLFIILNNGEICEFKKSGSLVIKNLPVFPPTTWAKIDEASRAMTPQDLLEADLFPKVGRLAGLRTDLKLSQIIQANRSNASLVRVLSGLISVGIHTLGDLLDGDPEVLFSGGIQRTKSKKVAAELLASEIKRSYKEDVLGFEQSLLMRELVNKGWPQIDSFDFENDSKELRIFPIEKDLTTYVSKMRGLTLKVQEIRASKTPIGVFDLVLSQNLVVTVNEELVPFEIQVPFWNYDARIPGTRYLSLNKYKFGESSLELLSHYAQAFNTSFELDLDLNLSNMEKVSNSQGASAYKRNGKVDYVALIKLEDLGHLELPREVLRNVQILRERALGQTLEQIGVNFGITREAIRQIVARHGGQDFADYLVELKLEQESEVEKDCKAIREYVVNHPGLSELELAVRFDKPFETLQNCLTKYEKKLLLGSRLVRDKTRYWSDQMIIDALQLAQTYYYPLTTSDYQELVNVGEIRGPSVPLITTRFKTWKQACIAAGVEFVESLTTYSVTWSREDLLEILGQYLCDPTTTGTIADYDRWRERSSDRIPSRAQLRIVVGPWAESCDEALGNIRSNSWDRPNDV